MLVFHEILCYLIDSFNLGSYFFSYKQVCEQKNHEDTRITTVGTTMKVWAWNIKRGIQDIQDKNIRFLKNKQKMRKNLSLDHGSIMEATAIVKLSKGCCKCSAVTKAALKVVQSKRPLQTYVLSQRPPQPRYYNSSKHFLVQGDPGIS